MADLGEEAFSSQMKVVATFLRLLEELIASMKALIVMLLILFAIIMVGIPQAYDFYTQDPLGIPVLIVVVLFAATGSVIIYKMADIDVE